MNILLIDDDANAVRPLRRLLEIHLLKTGIRLYNSPTIRTGLKEANDKAKSIDLVLLDIFMPCVAGPEEALTFVRKFKQPVACFSAHDELEIRQAASESGAIGFISKSDSPEEKIEQIDEIIEQIRHARIRGKTEETQGYALRPKNRDSKLAVVVSVTILLSFGGGVLLSAVGYGASHQKDKDHFDTLDYQVQVVDKKIDEKSKELSKQNETNAEKLDDHSRTLHRMDINVKLLLQKNGIAPAREGE